MEGQVKEGLFQWVGSHAMGPVTWGTFPSQGLDIPTSQHLGWIAHKSQSQTPEPPSSHGPLRATVQKEIPQLPKKWLPEFISKADCFPQALLFKSEGCKKPWGGD